MTVHRFGDFEFDAHTHELERRGRPVALRPQASRALKLLLQHPNRLVTREQLRRSIWGSTVVEWQAGLHQVMRQLRRALDDDPRHPAFIETVPTRGYRFKLAAAATDSGVRDSRASGQTHSRYRDAAFFALGLLSLPALVVFACSLLAA